MIEHPRLGFCWTTDDIRLLAVTTTRDTLPTRETRPTGNTKGIMTTMAYKTEPTTRVACAADGPATSQTRIYSRRESPNSRNRRKTGQIPISRRLHSQNGHSTTSQMRTQAIASASPIQTTQMSICTSTSPTQPLELVNLYISRRIATTLSMTYVHPFRSLSRSRPA